MMITSKILIDSLSNFMKEEYNTRFSHHIMGIGNINIEKLSIDIHKGSHKTTFKFNRLMLTVNRPTIENINKFKRVILAWLKHNYDSVAYYYDGSDYITFILNNEEVMNEAVIKVFHRNPKTNKITMKYQCIGGLKNGRKVSNPETCLQPPDMLKRVRMRKMKNMKAGSIKKSIHHTKFNNIVYKRVKLGNRRLKKARGL